MKTSNYGMRGEVPYATNDHPLGTPLAWKTKKRNYKTNLSSTFY